MIICVGNEKGGVGKTTLAFTLAYYFSQNQRVALIDTDPQRTSANLAALRHHFGLETKFTVVEKTVGSGAGQLAIDLSTSYDVVIIDVGARDLPALAELARFVDLWFAPTGVGQPDVFSTVELATAFSRAHDKHKAGRIPLCVFVNLAPTSSKSEGEDCRDALRDALPEQSVLNTIVHARKVWRDASRQGMTIFEMAARDRERACEEFVALVKEALKTVGAIKSKAKGG